MATTEPVDVGRALETVQEELRDIYRDRQDTALQVWSTGIKLSRAGRGILVTFAVSGTRGGPGYDIRIVRLSNALDGERIKNTVTILLVVGVIVLAWLDHIGDPHVKLYATISMAVFIVFMGIMIAIAQRDRKENEKVFSQSEVERLRTRLNLRLDELTHL
jgi:hypothetical protein